MEASFAFDIEAFGASNGVFPKLTCRIAYLYVYDFSERFRPLHCAGARGYVETKAGPLLISTLTSLFCTPELMHSTVQWVFF